MNFKHVENLIGKEKRKKMILFLVVKSVITNQIFMKPFAIKIFWNQLRLLVLKQVSQFIILKFSNNCLEQKITNSGDPLYCLISTVNVTFYRNMNVKEHCDTLVFMKTLKSICVFFSKLVRSDKSVC